MLNLVSNRQVNINNLKCVFNFYKNVIVRIYACILRNANNIYLFQLMLSQAVPFPPKPLRPSSLNVSVTAPSITKNNELAGISISTPSQGMMFNFESLMGGGTGLTPVSGPLPPSCSTQQRNIPVSVADLNSPDSQLPPKLVSL